jgi:ribosomal protein S12 methylthiotransferase accessory factor YcaO
MKEIAAERQYRLALQETAFSTGYFTVVPQDRPSLEDCLAYLCGHPADSFMHAHVLDLVGKMEISAVERVLQSDAGRDPAVKALLLEAALIYEHLSGIKKRLHDRKSPIPADHSPLIFLRSEGLADQALHRQWVRLFKDNIKRHRPLPPPQKTGLAFPVKGVDGKEETLPAEAHLKAVIECCRSQMDASDAPPRVPLTTTIENAMARLEALDIFEGPEMRHQSSLSPYALLRKWSFNHRVQSGRLNYVLAGNQTSYGRGLTLETARASCLMEVAERYTAFAGVDETGIVGTRRARPLMHGSFAQLRAEGFPLLDPNHLSLEAPYRDEPLYWIEGERLTAAGNPPIWVPAQCVFLFCNLDERSLFSGLGSTGLASGNTTAEARLSALYEVLERDGEAVNPYHPARCFRIYSEDERLDALLTDYRARGIHLQFQDISPAFGIPGCTCFVTHLDGTVARGGGANLDGKRAVLSALTETPYPYPGGPPAAPPAPDLPWLQFETLPDFSSGIPEKDLLLVEKTLLANGLSPIYVDITSKDLDIPVVKALVPGLEMMADFDPYSRINPRLFNNYLKIHKKS